MGANKRARGSWSWALTALTTHNKKISRTEACSVLPSFYPPWGKQKAQKKKNKHKVFVFLQVALAFLHAIHFVLWCIARRVTKPNPRWCIKLTVTDSDISISTWLACYTSHLHFQSLPWSRQGPSAPASHVPPCFQRGLHCYACINYFTYACFMSVCLLRERTAPTQLCMACEAQTTIHLCALAPTFWHYRISYKIRK